MRRRPDCDTGSPAGEPYLGPIDGPNIACEAEHAMKTQFIRIAFATTAATALLVLPATAPIPS
ncbi:MAG TPA: hypothetical protein VEH84_15835, partial [Alphaproteobacteria bacterium]|nr:hypothetical protein [Alphaproteobacteria bacterium]